MKISDYLIGVILVGAVIVSLYAFASELGSEQHYNVPINNSYAATYNKINELQNITSELYNKTTSISSQTDKNFFTGTWDVFVLTKDVITAGGSGIKTGYEIGSILLHSLIIDVGDGFDIYGSVLTIILTILIISALIFLILRRRF